MSRRRRRRRHVDPRTEAFRLSLGLSVERWRSMVGRMESIVARCTVPWSRDHPDYGGRGITVHPAWLADRLEFLLYLVSLPGWDDQSLSLDRIENDSGYVPGNLRWATVVEQNNNRRTSNRVRRRKS